MVDSGFRVQRMRRGGGKRGGGWGGGAYKLGVQLWGYESQSLDTPCKALLAVASGA